MLGYLTKLLPMGPFGPRIDDHDAQCDRAQDGKVNTMFHCFTVGVFITGLTSPNQKFFTKMIAGGYWSEANGIGSKRSTLNTEVQQLRVQTSEAGSIRGPFVALIPVLLGPKKGNSLLVYWDDSKSAPPPRHHVKRTEDGPNCRMARKMAGDKGAYWWQGYAKHEMKLTAPCLRQLMLGFTEASKIDAELTTWDPATWEVENKWIDQTGQYYDDAAAQMEALGIDIEAGITHLTVQGVDEV